MGETYKSIFKPQNPKKYKGNASNIICRSSWERRFCIWCDTNSNILSWASEEFSIPYVSPIDNKVHRYYPDFLIEVKESDGTLKKYVIEIKPKKQTVEPKKRSKVTPSYINEVKAYAVNQAKWKSSKEFCNDNRIEFQLITEDQLFTSNGRRVPRKRHK